MILHLMSTAPIYISRQTKYSVPGYQAIWVWIKESYVRLHILHFNLIFGYAIVERQITKSTEYLNELWESFITIINPVIDIIRERPLLYHSQEKFTTKLINENFQYSEPS